MARQCKIIVVFNQKGGCGKTTTACNLAGTFGHRGFRAVVVDLDPQGTAASWIRAKKGVNFPGDVVEGHKLPDQQHLYAKLQELQQQYDVIVIDCAPSVESGFTWAVLLVADFILVPTKLNATDIGALHSALRLVKRGIEHAKRDIPVRLVPVAYKKSESDQKMALALLEKGALNDGIPSTEAILGDRVPFKRAAQYGATAHSMPRATDAVTELEALTDEVAAILTIPAHMEA